jgi:hypothetical protein
MKPFETPAGSPERADIRAAIRAPCDRFDDDYWAGKESGS